MRICLISREFCRDTPLGGIGRANEMEARMLAAAGLEVHVITLAPGTEAESFVSSGVHIHRLPEPSVVTPADMEYVRLGVWSSTIAETFARLDAEVGFDIVETADYYGESLHLDLRPGTRLVTWLHSASGLLWDYFDEARRTPGNRVAAQLELTAVQRADLVLAPTSLVLDRTNAQLPIPLPNTRVIPNLFDFGNWPAREAAPSSGRLELVYVGRVEHLKGPDLAVHVLAALQRRGRDARLTLVGSYAADYRASVVDRLAHELGVLDCLEYPGRVQAEALVSLLHRADCAVLPSRYDNFHFACLEALACGVPVLTSDQTGLASWLGTDAGLYTRPIEDPFAFGEHGADVIAERAALAAAGARAAAETREIFAPGRTVSALLDAYSDLTGGKVQPVVAARSQPSEPQRPFRPVAILPAFNEGDVIHHAIGDLIANGLDVYLLDNCSTDDTVEQAKSWLGRGLLHIERFPDDAGYSDRCKGEYVWREILSRIEEVATELEADWFVLANADEFRESPWPSLDLREALRFVDLAGYNAVNFALANFQPIDDDFVHGTDVRAHMHHWEEGGAFDLLQLKAWKNTGVRVDLASVGGHDVSFPGRRVCPVPFVLRHYPLRGEQHALRKIHQERLARFAPEERADGWHVQYDELVTTGRSVLRDPSELVEWDGDAFRVELLAKATHRLLLNTAIREPERLVADVDAAALSPIAARLGVTGEELLAAMNVAPQLAHLGSDEASRRISDRELPLLEVAASLAACQLIGRGSIRDAAPMASLAATLADRRRGLVSARPQMPGARSFAALAFADEIAEDPSLLRAYAGAIGSSDDMTLVVWDRDVDATTVGEKVWPALVEAGLDREDGPDMLAIGAPVDETAVASSVRALVTRRRPPLAFSALPRFDEQTVAALRAASA